jgi:MFS family permease
MRFSGRSPEHVVRLLCWGLMLSLFGDTAVYIVLPTHTAEAGILFVDVGLMLSANRLIRIFINSPYGLLIERWPRRRVLIASQLLGAVANLLYVVTGFWPMLIGRLLWGVAWAGIWIGGNTAVMDTATDANRGRFVGRFHMWAFAGFVGGALTGGLLADLLGFQMTFVIFSGVSLAAGLLWAFFLPETRPQAAHSAHHHPTGRDHTPAPPRRPTYGEKLPVLLTIIVIMALNWLIFLGVIGAVLPVLLQERIGSTLAIGALLIPLTTLTGMIAAGRDTVSVITASVAGRISDWLPSRWPLVIGGFVLGSGALLIIAVGSGIVVVIGILLGAITASLLQTQATTLVGDYSYPNQQGRVLGVTNTAGDIGSATGPLLAFALINPDGLNWSLGTLFGLAAALLILVLPAVIWIAGRESRIPVTAPADR